METLKEIISHQFSWGLCVGLILLIFSWRSNSKDKKYLKNEISRFNAENAELQSHLSTQLKINAKGNETLQEKLNELQTQNETLRVNIQSLQQKPGKLEQRRLEVMEAAIATMREQAPGFAQAWEKSVRQAETDMESAEGGLKKLMRKVASFRTTSSDAKTDEPKLLEANNKD